MYLQRKRKSEKMTKKRFVHYEHKGADYILENPNTHLDFIEMLGDCLDEKEIVNRLNELYDEIDILKDENKGLIEENEKLKAQLYCPFDSVCIKCQYEYLVHTGDKFYVSKCRKGHKECSKVDVKYCDDFKLKGDVE